MPDTPAVTTEAARAPAERGTGGPWLWLPAQQQPAWSGHGDLGWVRDRLSEIPPLVGADEIDTLTADLARAAAGGARILQAGDCAEDLRECTPAHLRAKTSVLAGLGGHLRRLSGQPVVEVGRIGGQFGKPRSSPVETVDGVEVPAFRGHIVHSETPTPEARRPDPLRMLRVHAASAAVADRLRRERVRRGRGRSAGPGPWTSHEALVLDYEAPLVRREADGRLLLGSTHLPWLGDRTRGLNAAHLALLGAVANPVGCKIGPAATPEDVARLCARLDPDRAPGRLVLIVRMGRARVAEHLPGIVQAVRRGGHPVVWLSDPMHGNTVHAPDGRKTRHLDDLVAEARAFQSVLRRHRQHPGGFHLEVAASDVTECVGGTVGGTAAIGRRYTTLCDPRLNPEQAHELLAACV
ncbi:3-deoxy-7-phosphoheptulonate synthase [Streptomonospora halophila]|uniref:Phospho-2-dehydro-3-deoxyheptonate aldolase n=1 Tax=Streptomonospora halophila TaxID=427369 RepID=A0ABP9GMA1_9ACTN